MQRKPLPEPLRPLRAAALSLALISCGQVDSDASGKVSSQGGMAPHGGMSGNTAGGATGGQAQAGGAGSTGAFTSGGAGASGGADSNGGSTGAPELDPSVTANYEWHECGRIPTLGKPSWARRASDGSVLVLEGFGRLLAYPSGSQSAVTLIEPVPGKNYLVAELSADGTTIVLSEPTAAAAFRAPSGAPIGVTSGPLQKVGEWTDAQGCLRSLTSSQDGAWAAAHDEVGHVCTWDLLTGKVTRIAPPGATEGNGESLAFVMYQGALRVYLDGVLSTHSRAGVQQSRVAVQLEPSSVKFAQFSGDGETLLVRVDDSLARGELAGVDASSGLVIWRQQLDQAVSAVGSSTFLLENGDLHDLHEGTLAVKASAPGSNKVSSWGRVSSLTGTNALIVNEEQVIDWDFARAGSTNQYGAHSSSIRALEVDRSGRRLASIAERIDIWELDSDFARSRLTSTTSAGPAHNVALSADGTAFITSGDWVTYFGPNGTFVGSEPPSGPSCLSANWAFAPSGEFAAGTEYGSDIVLRNTLDFSSIGSISAANCGGGLAFSPDGTLLATASLELFETQSLKRRWMKPPEPGTHDHFSFRQNAVSFAPNGKAIVRTLCDDDVLGSPCSTATYDAQTGAELQALPTLTGEVARYSPEGHWLVSGNRVQHLPTGRLLDYDAVAAVATFTPHGDIIAGENDGSLVQFCRSEP